MSFSCVFFGALWLDAGEGCANMRAPAPACSLARALRALAGGLSKERLGRLALLGNASEILPKTLPEASQSSLWPSWGSFSPSWRLGSLWGASRELQKPLPNRSRRLSRRPPAPELVFRSIMGAILVPFWDSPDLKKQGFRMEGVACFNNSRGPENTLKTET